MSDGLGGNAATAHTGAQSGRRGAWGALLALTAVLGLATSAPAIVITGGPTYTPGGGWTCTTTAAGSEKIGTGATYSCSGTAGAFSNLYIGVNKNTSVPFGDKMNSSGGSEPSGNEVFTWSADGSTFIRYVGQTAIVGYGPLVDTRVTLTFSGTGSVVSDATTQALTGANIRGALGVHSLWHIDPAVSAMTVNVLIEASDAGAGAWQPAETYFGTGAHRKGTGSTEVDRSHVDLAFYTSSCGDSIADTSFGREQCDLGGGNGGAPSCCSAACQYNNNTTICRTSGGVCDLAETCTGASAICPGDSKSTAQCRAAATTCDAAEFCDGAGNNCPADGFASPSTVCRAAGGACDLQENCTGSSPTCPADAKSTAQCRASGGVCDIAEVCDGVSNNCPADAKSTTQCRAAVGGCDVAELCDGSNDDCPGDTIASSGAECRAAAGICDVAETCDGVSTACPPDAFVAGGTECRAVAGICDIAEACTGTGPNCPPDGFEPSSTVCRASSVGEVCDIPENCTGSSAACPVDSVEPNTTVCRPSAGDCDVVDTCDGVNKTCPADAVQPSSTVCRAASSGETCDATENCDGVNVVCPADAVLPNGTTCRASAGICDATEACDGSSKLCPSDAKSTATCRASAGACDVAEVCDGLGDDCPADTLQPDGTNCDDSAFCNGVQTCTSGVCGGGTNPCPMGQSCDETSNACFSGDCPVNPASCLVAAKNKVLIKNNTSDNSKDKVIWKWTKGAATMPTDFDDPVSGTAKYTLCFYAGTTSALIQQATVPPAGGKWSPISTKGFKYKDTTGTNAGITKIIVKSGAGGKSKALVKGKGVNLPDFDSDLPIATPDLPLVVQLRNSQTGLCWGGSFATPKKNLLTQFNAKQP